MALSLMLGLGSIAAAILLACLAGPGRAPSRAAHPGVHTIEQFYSQAGGLFTEPTLDHRVRLSGPMLVARKLGASLSPGNVLSRIQHRLDVAGNPRGWTAERILAFKGLGVVCAGVAGLLLGLHSAAMLVVLAPSSAVLGFFLPDLLVYNTGLKRQQRIQRELPDALDMMTVCVEAGLGFDAALSQVARNTEGAVASEFARVLQEMQFGKSRTQALRAMADRTTVSELSSFVSALVQASDLGIAIGTVLREQAQEMRTRRRQRGEEQAQKVTVKILFPLIFCIFPALMVIVMGPGALNIMHMFAHL